MKELITEQQAHLFIIALSILIFVGSLVITFVLSRQKKVKDPQLLWPFGITTALMGPTVFILWTIYNSIENHYGLDSVKALLINLVLFLVVGVVIALIYSRIPNWVSRGKSARKR